jgi:hypothetical protein
LEAPAAKDDDEETHREEDGEEKNKSPYFSPRIDLHGGLELVRG